MSSFRFILEKLVVSSHLAPERATLARAACASVNDRVHEAVAAEDHINRKQRIVHEIDLPKPHPVTGVLCLITLDQFTDQITADIVDAGQVGVLHPVKVAAREIEQRRRAQLLEQ